jgi:hypothetical protein
MKNLKKFLLEELADWDWVNSSKPVITKDRRQVLLKDYIYSDQQVKGLIEGPDGEIPAVWSFVNNDTGVYAGMCIEINGSNENIDHSKDDLEKFTSNE